MGHMISQASPKMDYNIARLGLICSQSRLPSRFQLGWESKNALGTISCEGSLKFGIPYGLAADILSGILTALMIQQTTGNMNPELRLSVAELMRLSGLKPHPRHYAAIDFMLSALHKASYTIENCWREPTLFRTYHSKYEFHILDAVAKEEVEHDFDPSKSRHMKLIRVNPDIAASVAGPLALSLTPHILQNLPSPSSRNIYRNLDALRRNDDDPTQVHDELDILLTEFIEVGRILSNQQHISQIATPLLRADGPLDILTKDNIGYLASYSVSGRGDASVLHLKFRRDGNLTDQYIIDLLTAVGVAPGKASSLSEAHSREEVECALWKIEKRKDVDDAAKYVIGILRNGISEKDLSNFRGRARPNTVSQPKTVEIQHPITRELSTRTIPAPEEPAMPVHTFESKLKQLGSIGQLSKEQAAVCRELGEQGLITLEHLKVFNQTTKDQAAEQIQRWQAGDLELRPQQN
ncbi:hypothetical protein [Deinococcus sp. Marseille-Q6407]|uniref:hypothetical protein n=2 Tax=unclassified Deinococcus TaxID=2623546 RepID=UPI0021BE4BC5|nr:hypothetical protein [Deinococcus sp. Marseille-Q6407]